MYLKCGDKRGDRISVQSGFCEQSTKWFCDFPYEVVGIIH